jgi:CRISPR-associated protein Csx14
MSNPQPSIRVNVDITNPGQFFACCGMLELADRLWPGAEGWFEEKRFCVSCEGTILQLLTALIEAVPEAATFFEETQVPIKPLIAPLLFRFKTADRPSFKIDVWTNVKLEKGHPIVAANPPWNFWSGQQTSHGIWCGLQAGLSRQLKERDGVDLEDLFSWRLFQKGRFGFDPGPSWNALDVGFSPNEQDLQVESSPAVEMLAAIGVQRFRPHFEQDRSSFEYQTWSIPLSPATAAAAVAGVLYSTPSTRLRGCVVARGQYAALGVSYRLQERASND